MVNLGVHVLVANRTRRASCTFVCAAVSGVEAMNLFGDPNEDGWHTGYPDGWNRVMLLGVGVFRSSHFQVLPPLVYLNLLPGALTETVPDSAYSVIGALPCPLQADTDLHCRKRKNQTAPCILVEVRAGLAPSTAGVQRICWTMPRLVNGDSLPLSFRR